MIVKVWAGASRESGTEPAKSGDESSHTIRHGSVGADTQRERQDGGGRAQPLPHAVRGVLAQVVEGVQPRDSRPDSFQRRPTRFDTAWCVNSR